MLPLGALQLRTKAPSPGVITKPDGTPGSGRAVTIAGDDAVPVPAVVIAETRNISGIPTRVAT